MVNGLLPAAHGCTGSIKFKGGQMSIVRRVFYYLLTLIALIVFANGLGQLLSLLFDITLRD
jgi:hypothetical protein